MTKIKKYPWGHDDIDSLRKSGDVYYYDNGKPRFALRYYDRVLAINPKDPETLHSKIHCYQDLNLDTDAINTVNTLLKITPHDEHIWTLKGNSYYNLDQFLDAIIYYEKALKENSKEDEALTNKGMCYYRLKKYDDAILYFDKSLKINSKDENTIHYKGHCLRELKKYSEAIQCFKKELSIYPENEYTWLEKGDCHEKLDEDTKALRSYEKGLSFNPEDEDTLSRLSIVLAKLRRYDEGLTYYQKAIEIKNKKKGKNIIQTKNFKEHLQLSKNHTNKKKPLSENEISRKIRQLERKIRKIIIQTNKNFDQWWTSIILEDVKKHIKKNISLQKYEKLIQNKDFTIIDYADFPDYKKIITDKNNWKKYFQSIFERKDNLHATLTILQRWRNEIAHSRKLKISEKENFRFHYNELRKLI